MNSLKTTSEILKYFKTNKAMFTRFKECYGYLLGNNCLTFDDIVWSFDDVNSRINCVCKDMDLWIKEIPYDMLDDDGFQFWKEERILVEL